MQVVVDILRSDTYVVIYYYASPYKMGRYIVLAFLSVCPSVRLSVRPSVYLSITLSCLLYIFWTLVGFSKNSAQISSVISRCAVRMFDQGWFKVKVKVQG